MESLKVKTESKAKPRGKAAVKNGVFGEVDLSFSKKQPKPSKIPRILKSSRKQYMMPSALEDLDMFDNEYEPPAHAYTEFQKSLR